MSWYAGAPAFCSGDYAATGPFLVTSSMFFRDRSPGSMEAAMSASLKNN